VTLKMPKGTRAATTGQVLRTSRGALVIRARNARDFALATGPFRVVTARTGTTRVRVSAPQEMSTGEIADAMRLARNALAAYERHYGPYGAPELDVVLGTFTAFGGMEYPQLVLTTPEFGPVRHEIAHQWFYGIVGNDQRHAPWLDESFATWLEEDLSGFPNCASPPVRVLPGVFLDSGMDLFDRRSDIYGRTVYFGGACALEEVAHLIGHTPFRALLRSYVAAHRDGVTTEGDFISALRAAAPPSFDVDAWATRARLRLG
jgi:aminopeptidase N